MKTRPRKGLGNPEFSSPQASVGSAPGQTTALAVAHKYRRALKNSIGATMTSLELQLLARLGALDLVTGAENQELMNRQEILAGSSSGPPSSDHRRDRKPP